MKGIDTPVLLEILRGKPSAKTLLKSWSGQELATTELNLIELDSIARAEGDRGRHRRREALEKLRRRLTVIPLDSRAARAASQLSDEVVRGMSPPVALMLGAAEAGGCSEWVTLRSWAPARLPGRLKVTLIGR